MRLLPRISPSTAVAVGAASAAAAAAPDEILTYVEASTALACDRSTLAAMLLLEDLRSGRLPKSFSKSLWDVKIDLGSEFIRR